MSPKLPVLKARDLIGALEAAGFQFIRQKGSHKIFGHPDQPELRVTVPEHGNHVIKSGTLKSILQQAGLTTEQLRDLL